MSEEELLIENFKLKDKLEKQRKDYQETYKDVREEIKELQKENNCLWERIKYLLTSRTVRMYDEVDPITKKHKFDISDLDNLQQRIDNALEWIDRTIEIIKMQPSEDDTWILERLNSFKLCLRGDSND